MTELVLQGPFLTRREATARLGWQPDEVASRPELLRVNGLLEECYFAFQCRTDLVGADIGRVVLAMRGSITDLEIADWLIRPNDHLNAQSPIAWLEHRWGLRAVLDAARKPTDASIRAPEETAGPRPSHRLRVKDRISPVVTPA